MSAYSMKNIGKAGRDLYRATPAVTRGLDFSRFISFSHLLQHTRGYGGPSILTRILTGLHSVAFTTRKVMLTRAITVFETVMLQSHTAGFRTGSLQYQNHIDPVSPA
jgi:hypothetical protein